jgi:hypothetical protein
MLSYANFPINGAFFNIPIIVYYNYITDKEVAYLLYDLAVS